MAPVAYIATLGRSPACATGVFRASAAEPEHVRPEDERSTSRLKSLRRQLESGSVPEELAETVRMIPLDSHLGRRFQKAMEDFICKYHPVLSRSAGHIRFFLMQEEAPNAILIKYSDPPLMGFTSGFFDLNHPNSPRTIEARLGCVLHEGGHFFQRGSGGTRNSPLEEIEADRFAVRNLHELNRDPMPFVEWLTMNRNDDLFIGLGDLVDPHPDRFTRASILQADVTARNAETREPALPAERISDEDGLTAMVREARYVSYLGRTLAKLGYEWLDLSGKARALAGFIEFAPLNLCRLREIQRELEKLREEYGEGREWSGNAEVNRLADVILDLAASGRTVPAVSSDIETSHLGRSLYTSLAGASGKGKVAALGRLAALSSDFLAFVESEDRHGAITAARRILRRLKGAHFRISDPDERAFLQGVALAGFPFPMTEGQEVSWNRHVKWAKTAAPGTRGVLAMALVLMGVEDSRIHPLLSVSRRAEMAQMLGEDEAGVRCFGFAGVLRMEPAGTEVYLQDDCSHARNRLDVFGVAISPGGKVRCIPSTYSELMAVRHANLRSRALALTDQRVIEHILLRHGDDPAKQYEAQRTVLSFRYYSHANLPIRMPLLREDPLRFKALNHSPLITKEGQRAVVSELHAMLEVHPDEGRRVIRRFYGIERTDESERLLNLFSDKPLEQPLLRYALKLPRSVLDLRELSMLLAVNSFRHCGSGMAESFDPGCFMKALRAFERSAPWFPDSPPQDLSSVCQLAKRTEAELPGWAPEASPEDRKLVLLHLSTALTRTVVKRCKPSPHDVLELVRFSDVLQSECKDRLYRFSGIRGPLRAALSEGVRSTGDLSEAVSDFIMLRDRNLLTLRGENATLSHLVNRLEQELPLRRRHRYVVRLLRHRRIFEPEAREKLKGWWCSGLRERFGEDDGTPDYAVKILGQVDRLVAALPRSDRQDFLNSLAVELCSQPALSYAFESRLPTLSGEDYERSIVIGIAGKALLHQVRRSARDRRVLLEFLTCPLTETSAKRIENRLSDRGGAHLEGGAAEVLYRNFWSTDFRTRALLTRELLLPPNIALSKRTFERALDYVTSRLAPDDAQHSDDLKRYARGYLESCKKYERPILLAAALSAVPPDEGEKLRLGVVLRRIGDLLGPGENKAVQAAHSHPGVKKEIRVDLGGSKIDHRPLARWTVLRLAEKQLTPLAAGSEVHFGRVAGSGSYYIGLEVAVGGREEMLLLKRPFAEQQAARGFRRLEGMIERAGDGGDRDRLFQELIAQGREDVASETNPFEVALRFEAARETYRRLRVTSGKSSTAFSSPRIDGAGEEYLLMERMWGRPLIQLLADPAVMSSEKERVAIEIVLSELFLILSGKGFCRDRHGGNAVKEASLVGHFDLGLFRTSGASEAELRALGRVFSRVIPALSSPSNLGEIFASIAQQEIRSIRPDAGGDALRRYLRCVTTAVLKLGEYLEHIPEDRFSAIVAALIPHIHPLTREEIFAGLQKNLEDGKGIELLLRFGGAGGGCSVSFASD